MPRAASRHPVPIALPRHPMDTLWEADEFLNNLTPNKHSSEAPSSRSRALLSSRSTISRLRNDNLRSFFEDDNEDLRDATSSVPPVTTSTKLLPSQRKIYLPGHSTSRSSSAHCPTAKGAMHLAPLRKSLSAIRLTLDSQAASFLRSQSTDISPQSMLPSTPPRRRRPDDRPPVSPTCSASGSDNEFPLTPPPTSFSLATLPEPKIRASVPPPPAEWEDAIEELFMSYDDLISAPSTSAKSAPPPRPTRRPPPPPRPHGSQSSSWSLAGSSADPLILSDTFFPTRPASPATSVDSFHTYASSAFAPSSIIPRKREVPSLLMKKKKVPVARGLVVGGALRALYRA